jgi:integrase
MKTTQIINRFEEALATDSSLTLKYGALKIALYIADSGPRYTVCWYSGAQRQRFGTNSRENALEKITSLVGGIEVGPEKKLSVEKVQEYLEADTLLGGVNLSDVVAFYKSHVNQYRQPLELVCEDYLAANSDKSQRYRETLRHHTRSLCKAFPNVAISHITSGDLDRYLTETFPNPKTRKNHRGAICALFNFAQRKNYLPAGIHEANKTERPVVRVVEPCVISADDMRRVLECDDPKLVAFFAVAAFAGCRAAEVIRLKWKNVKDDSIVLPPEITKTNRRRIAELPPNLAEWLKPLRGEDNEYVTYPETSIVYRRTKNVFKNAGVTREANALRHTFVSCHLEMHCDPPRTAKTAGHSLAVLESSYLKLVSKREAEDWFSIAPPPDKSYKPVKIRRMSRKKFGKTWAEIAAARNATVKAAKRKTNQTEEKKPCLTN